MSTLDRYLVEREEQSPIEKRELQVEESPQLEEMMKAFDRWLYGLGNEDLGIEYHTAVQHTQHLSCSATDVQAFSLHMEEFQTRDYFWASGYFISALINNGTDEKYVVVTEHLHNQLSYLGLGNTKDVIILGDARNQLGAYMSQGMLTLSGNAKAWAGKSLSGGILTIEGNAGVGAGHVMTDGTLHIKGNAGPMAGSGMLGGVLRVDGDIRLVAWDWREGEIYEGGRRVRPRPEDAR